MQSVAMLRRSCLQGRLASLPSLREIGTLIRDSDASLGFGGGSLRIGRPLRLFSADSKKDEKDERCADSDDSDTEEKQKDNKSSSKQGDEELSSEELAAALNETRQALEDEQKSAQQLKEKLLRTLADMENLRERTSRATAEAKQFAVAGLVKSIVDVADNLERAAGSIPDLDGPGVAELDRDRALILLRSLRDGVLMTDDILMKLLNKEGVIRYDPIGDAFDPNLHNALFQVPDATKEPGTIAVVVKKGYSMHDRPIRAAEVGVVSATEET